MSFIRTSVLTVILLVLAACGGGEDQPAGSAGNGTEPPAASAGGDAATEAAPHARESHHATDDTDYAFGRPADAADADRTIEIHTDNELAFDPAEVTVAAGETVTFSITNDGDLPHDFVIGDQAAQQEHAEEMAAMDEDMAMEGGQHGDANAVSVSPGETVELTWVFDGATDGLLYGCHEPGHYEAGMVGDILVEG